MYTDLERTRGSDYLHSQAQMGQGPRTKQQAPTRHFIPMPILPSCLKAFQIPLLELLSWRNHQHSHSQKQERAEESLEQ